MKEKNITNAEILSIFKEVTEGEVWKGLEKKHLPIDMLCAIQRSFDNAINAYKSYYKISVQEILNNHDQESDQDEIESELDDLLKAHTSFQYVPITKKMLKECDKDKYDSLTLDEIGLLDWMIDEK